MTFGAALSFGEAMKQRDKTRGKAAKGQRRQTVRRRNTAKVARRRKPYAADANEKVALLEQKLNEALEQQTAMSEILGVISNSPTDLAPVFSAILANATRLCEGNLAALWRYDGKFLIGAAQYNASAAFVDKYMGTKMQPGRSGPARLAALERRTVHVADITAEPGFSPVVLQYERARTVLAVPLLRKKDLLGVIAIWRREVRPFTDKQIELVRNFAAQAVIAIENARLLNELRQRTDDLSKSLEQQTATSEILEVISNSPTNTQPAFDAIVRSGLNLFLDAVVAISLPDRDLVKLAAIGGADEAGLEALRGRYPMPLSHEFITGTAILDRREIDLADAHEPPKELTVGAQNLLAGGYCAMTVMPMMRGDETIGALNVIRRHRGPLSDKQRELLRTFANQAVIAIENTRLFNELRESLSSRRPRPTCSRSSAGRRSICRPCSIR